MQKRIAVAAGLLVMLGTTASGVFGDADAVAEQAAIVDSSLLRTTSHEAAQQLAKLSASPASVPLARPL
ncbi:MAG: hypothetical protein ABW106_04395 [Steroidobacteraceae bacterium]